MQHFFRSLITGFLILVAMPAWADETEVLACVRANLPVNLHIGQFVLRNDAGTAAETRLLGQAWYTRPPGASAEAPARLKLRLDRPAAYAGSAYLVRDMQDARRGVFIYLPSLGKVRRVAPDLSQGQLFNSEFEYQDLRLLHAVLRDIKLRRLGEQSQRGRPLRRYAVETGEAWPDAGFTAEVWLDMETCLPHRLQLMRDGVAYKEISLPIEDVRPLGQGWIPTEIVAHNLLTGRRSVINFSRLDERRPIDERHWHPHRFYEATP